MKDTIIEIYACYIKNKFKFNDIIYDNYFHKFRISSKNRIGYIILEKRFLKLYTVNHQAYNPFY